MDQHAAFINKMAVAMHEWLSCYSTLSSHRATQQFHPAPIKGSTFKADATSAITRKTNTMGDQP